MQILERICDTGLNQDDCRLVRNCISGFIYDSSPVDFTSDLGARLAVHPTTLRMSKPPKPFVWAANGIASSLDYVFLNRFESQRAEFWQTLYSTIVRSRMFFFCFNYISRLLHLISFVLLDVADHESSLSHSML